MSQIFSVENEETEAEVVRALAIDFYRLGDPGTGHEPVLAGEFEAMLFKVNRLLRPDEVEELVSILDEAWKETVQGESLSDFAYDGKYSLVINTEIMESAFDDPFELFDEFVSIVKDDIAGKFADLSIEVLVDEVVQDLP